MFGHCDCTIDPAHTCHLSQLNFKDQRKSNYDYMLVNLAMMNTYKVVSVGSKDAHSPPQQQHCHCCRCHSDLTGAFHLHFVQRFWGGFS